MQKKNSFTGLLITSLWAVVSCDLIKQYHFVNQQMNWTDAQQYCRDKYLDLAFISSQTELDEIYQKSGTTRIWIGMQRVSHGSNEWKWSGGWISMFRVWDGGQPNNYGGSQDCIDLWQSGMNDDDCYNKFNFVCFDLNVVLVQEDKTWEEALDYCRDHYSDLTSLMSDNEQLKVQYIMNSNGVQTDQVWTGLRYLANQWLWVNGDPLVKLSWTGGSLPSCPEHFHCGTLASEEQLWGTRDCDERRYFLCSKNVTT